MTDYTNLQEIKEATNHYDANHLIGAGWKLLNIYNAPDPYVVKAQIAVYVMGYFFDPLAGVTPEDYKSVDKP